jgi:glutathione S-transferase
MPQSLPILYSFRRCPYAMRARYALYTAKIPHEHREVSLKNKPAQMLEISPKGTVPVLQLVDGIILEQSLDIMKWALKDSHLSDEDRELIHENDTSFKSALDRYKYPHKNPGQKAEENSDYRALCEGFLEKLEKRLDPFLSCSTMTFLDMALFPFVRQFAHVDLSWFEGCSNYPRLKIWLDSLTASTLFEQVMHDYSPWSLGDEPVVVFKGL